jgi:hypothetical protein
MKIEQVKEIANAVLYEGYLLYPYRHTAIKNRQRWTIGVVYPREYSEANGSVEPWTMQTECLVEGQADTSLDVHVRFLHLLVRTAVQSEMTDTPSKLDVADTHEWSLAGRMANDPWEEGVEREVSILNLSLNDLMISPRCVEIDFPGRRMVEYMADGSTAEIVREQRPVMGAAIITAGQVGSNLFKVRVQIENTTSETRPEILERTAQGRRDTVFLQSFISTHTILLVHGGAFISLLDPPEAAQAVATGCQNRHTWPVLVGKEGDRSTMLSSPIILYDYPQIAPESPGALFDGTEIDEILTLRIMTLTDEEKEQIRQGDARAREILERTEALSPEQFMKLHGTIRSLQPGGQESGKSRAGKDYPGEDYPPPTAAHIAGRQVKAGDRVRLHPKARADAFDMLLEGKTARVESIEQDFENRTYLVVTVDDDPGREQWDERVLPGHRFFFFPQEVELLEEKEEIAEREL